MRSHRKRLACIARLTAIRRRVRLLVASLQVIVVRLLVRSFGSHRTISVDGSHIRRSTTSCCLIGDDIRALDIVCSIGILCGILLMIYAVFNVLL